MRKINITIDGEIGCGKTVMGLFLERVLQQFGADVTVKEEGFTVNQYRLHNEISKDIVDAKRITFEDKEVSILIKNNGCPSLTDRAKRLGEYLERAGWSVFDTDPVSIKCECGTETDTKYCPDCGRKMGGTEKNVLEVMEAAIKYAMKE